MSTLKPIKEDVLDLTLRPRTWDEYIGQSKVKQNVRIIIEAAKKRKEAPEHLLFHGNPGLGKTTIALLIANEIGAEVRMVSGPSIEKPGDLAAILTNLEPETVLFIDEIHRLPKTVEEYLYPAMEDFKLHLVLGRGPMARIMDLEVPKFTLIGATTKMSAVSGPLRSRFGANFTLNFYQIEEIEKILERSAKVLQVEIEKQALPLIAKCSRFTPRAANHLLKRVRDFAQVEGQGIITPEITKKALQYLEIDDMGLTDTDRRILQAICLKFNGGPVGLQALAASTAEEEGTILEIYEPYLMRLGFITRSPRGRMATNRAFQHIKGKKTRLF